MPNFISSVVELTVDFWSELIGSQGCTQLTYPISGSSVELLFGMVGAQLAMAASSPRGSKLFAPRPGPRRGQFRSSWRDGVAIEGWLADDRDRARSLTAAQRWRRRRART